MTKNRFLLTAIISSLFLGSIWSSPVVAMEEVVEAIAPWKGDGFAFPVGEERAYMVGVYSGIMFVRDGKGSLHAGSIVCPGTIDADLEAMTKSGQGHCIITNVDGDRVFAEFTCSGDLESCKGPFTLVGGTGKFAGITGGGEMISQMQSQQVITVEGYESSRQKGEGIAVWPKLHYTIPSTP